MKSFFRKLSLVFASGFFGGVLNAVVVWLFGRAEITAELGVKIAPSLTPAYLYQRTVWGGIWGFLFPIPAFKNRPLSQGLLFSLGPTIVHLFVIFPNYLNHRGVEKLRAGATSEDLLDASDSIAKRGFTINDGYLHGFGIGLLPPSIGTRESGLGIPEPPFVFEENMCVVLQPNVVTHDERAGVQLGNCAPRHEDRQRVPARTAG